MSGSPLPGTVLCVDDDMPLLECMRLSLRKIASISVANSGRAGLDWIAEHGKPDVVISDMNMPGMDGIAFLSAVRELAPDTTRVLLTGQADLDSAVSAVNQGRIFRFLTKPCRREDLLEAVISSLERHRLSTRD
jgi:DNA-binding NtrC family response regulator